MIFLPFYRGIAKAYRNYLLLLSFHVSVLHLYFQLVQDAMFNSSIGNTDILLPAQFLEFNKKNLYFSSIFKSIVNVYINLKIIYEVVVKA